MTDTSLPAKPAVVPIASGVPTHRLADRPLVTPVTLPSRGIPYNVGGKNWLPEGKCLVSSMTVKDVKMYANKALDPHDKASLLLFNTCLFGELKPDDLILADQFFLLIKVRAISYGNKYPFQMMCSACDTQFKHEIDIERTMGYKELSDEWEEPFKVQLPVSQHIVELRLLRGADERAISSKVKKSKQQGGGEAGAKLGLALAQAIMTVNGETLTGLAAQAFVEKLAMRDCQAIEDTIDENSCGYDPEFEVPCSECGFNQMVRLPFGPDFFRATDS